MLMRTTKPAKQKLKVKMLALKQQLALQLYLPKNCSFENFIDTENKTAVHCLKNLLSDADGDRLAYLWGSRGTGKSHLLAAGCRWASEHYYTSVYLPLSSVKHYGVQILTDLEELYYVAIDNLECIVGNMEWETQLFHLYNRVTQSNVRLILCADQPPQALPFVLPDLKSRMCSTLVFQLSPLDEIGKRQVMHNFANERGLQLSNEVLDYILHRQDRDLEKLLQLMEKLDKASLREYRRLTIPFVKKVLLTN